MVTDASTHSSTLREPEIAALRRRLLMARHLAEYVGPGSASCDAQLREARTTYVADVESLLEERRFLLETTAALRRVAVAAEAALFESRAGQQPKRLQDLVRALQVAGYATDSASAQVALLQPEVVELSHR